MGTYKRDVVVVIKMGAYIHGVLFCVCGCLFSPILRYAHNAFIVHMHDDGSYSYKTAMPAVM